MDEERVITRKFFVWVLLGGCAKIFLIVLPLNSEFVYPALSDLFLLKDMLLLLEVFPGSECWVWILVFRQFSCPGLVST